MKTLGTMTQAGQSVTVTASQRDDGSILLVASCGQTTREHVFNPAPSLDYTEDQFLSDIDAAKQAISDEAAAYESQRLMQEKFFSDQTTP
jgi:hypothetical protein